MDKMNKVVYVYLVFEKKDYFFGSIAAIYDHLSAEQVGAGYALECPVERDVGAYYVQGYYKGQKASACL